MRQLLVVLFGNVRDVEHKELRDLLRCVCLGALQAVDQGREVVAGAAHLVHADCCSKGDDADHRVCREPVSSNDKRVAQLLDVEWVCVPDAEVDNEEVEGGEAHGRLRHDVLDSGAALLQLVGEVLLVDRTVLHWEVVVGTAQGAEL